MIQELSKKVRYSLCLMQFHLIHSGAILLVFLHPLLQSTHLNKTAYMVRYLTYPSILSFPLLKLLHCAPNTRKSWGKKKLGFNTTAIIFFLKASLIFAIRVADRKTYSIFLFCGFVFFFLFVLFPKKVTDKAVKDRT